MNIPLDYFIRKLNRVKEMSPNSLNASLENYDSDGQQEMLNSNKLSTNQLLTYLFRVSAQSDWVLNAVQDNHDTCAIQLCSA